MYGHSYLVHLLALYMRTREISKESTSIDKEEVENKSFTKFMFCIDLFCISYVDVNGILTWWTFLS